MSGTILRGDDGSLYFIRDEVLAACRVEGEYLDRVNQMLSTQEAEVEGFAFNLRESSASQLNLMKPVGYARGDFLSGPSIKAGDVPSTVMCPW